MEGQIAANNNSKSLFTMSTNRESHSGNILFFKNLKFNPVQRLDALPSFQDIHDFFSLFYILIFLIIYLLMLY